MFRNLELYLLEVIKGKRKGFVASFLKIFLRLFSWIFQFLVLCRNWAFDQGWLCKYYPPVPVVISIGNIVVGGTGKTPVTLKIATEFYQEFLLAILSRGYRSEAEHLSSPVVLCKGNGPLHSATYCGDEPYLLAQNLPKAFVVVGRDRHKASDLAAKAGVQLILLDDGMQHRCIARDFEVIVLDATNPFGHRHFLPHGLLRDSLNSLARAHLIILNHISNPETYHSLSQEIASYSRAPVVGTKMELVQVCDLQGNSIPSIQGKRVGIFCGIGNPEHFQQTVIENGGVILSHYFMPDHRSISLNDLKEFAQHCFELGAEMLLCTEKDRVKLETKIALPLPINWLQMGLIITEGEAYWKHFIEKAKTDLLKRI